MDWLRKGVSERICKRCFITMLIFAAGATTGAFFMKYHTSAMCDTVQRTDDFSYGIEEQDLSVENVSWQTYPGFRTVTFDIEGTFTINVPKSGTCVLQDLTDEAKLEETQRETVCRSDGKASSLYDRVQYELSETTVQSLGLPKKADSLSDAMQGYHIALYVGETEWILGYIPPMCKDYDAWSERENYYARYNYEKYLSSFSLSKTYTDNDTMPATPTASKVCLNKVEGSVFDCVIDNTQGMTDWEFKAMVPTIELWYHGIWIEADSSFDDNLTMDICHAGEKKELVIPPDTAEHYSYFLPGIYRLVVWGTNNDFIISESFTIDM